MLLSTTAVPVREDPEEAGCNVTYGCTKAEEIGYYFFYTPICVTGIVLNSINAVVLSGTKFKLNGSTFTYLTAMAFADLMTLSLAWPIGIMRCAPYKHTWQFYFRQVYEIYIFLPIMNSSATASVWMTVAVSVERYMFIAKSFLSMSLCSRLQAKRTVGFICIGAFAVNFPYFFYRRVSHTEDNVYTDWALSTGYEVYSWCRLFLVKLIPIVLATVFNCMLGMTVIEGNRRRRSIIFPISVRARRQRMQLRTTAMLIVISVIFILCHIMEPFIHSGIYKSLFGECSVYTETYALLRVIVNTLEMFSYASNFVVYCIFNRQFLRALARKCQCCHEHCSCCKNAAQMETTVVNTIHTLQ